MYRDSVKVTQVPTPDHQSFETLECLIHASTCVRLCVIYRTPNAGTISVFFDEFSDYMASVMTSPGKPLIVGDFNFHVNDNQDRDACLFANVTSSFGLCQHVSGPTHRNGHTLDLVFSHKDDEMVSAAAAIDHGFPDHWPVFTTLSLTKPPLPTKTFTCRRIKNVPVTSLKDRLSTSPITDPEYFESLDLDDATTLYRHELGLCLDDLAPIRQQTVTLRPPSRWYNETIRTAKQRRRQKERMWRKTGLTVHREIFLEERNRVNEFIIQAKRAYYRNAITDCGNDTKRLFRLTSEVLGKKKSLSMPSPDLPMNLPEIFGDFFMKKIENIHASIPTNDDQILPELTVSDDVISLLLFEPLSIEDTKRLISRSASKTCDLDPVPTEWVKVASEELSPVIRSIANKSFRDGTFPSSFKRAIVIPRLKKSSLDPASCSNYRPVSNLCFLSKVLERAAADQLTRHLETQQLQEPLQSAYRTRHSTETAMVKVHDDICRAIGEGHVVLLVLLDLSAAFDTVSHELLLSTLSKYKIGGTALQWLKSYLADRDQVVRIDGVTSEPRSLECGVPQGSVLGPLLFSVYTCSLGHVLRTLGVGYHLYADDTQVYISIEPEKLQEGVARMEECVRHIRAWMSQHNLKMNEEKTEFLVLSNRHVGTLIDIPALDVCGHLVTASRTAKNIGVVMDPHMHMDAHVTKICQSAYRQLYCIAKLRQYMDRISLECIVHAFITTRLDYCNAILSGANQNTKKKLQRVQNAAARVLTGTKRREHITPVLRQLHWLPVEVRIEFKVLVMTFKCIHNFAPPYLCQMIRPYTPARDLRTADQMLLCVPFTQSEFIRNNVFGHVGPALFNRLPYQIRRSPSLEIFKNRLKTYLFTNFYS